MNASCRNETDADGLLSPWNGQRHEIQGRPVSLGASQSGQYFWMTLTISASGPEDGCKNSSRNVVVRLDDFLPVEHLSTDVVQQIESVPLFVLGQDDRGVIGELWEDPPQLTDIH